MPTKTANSAALANLLRNPHLMRPSKLNNGENGNSINEELLQEDNEEQIINNKPKRSRGLNEVNQQIITFNHNSVPVVNETEIVPTETNAPANHKSSTNDNNHVQHVGTTVPMEVSHSTMHFLSAEPGSQACRKK